MKRLLLIALLLISSGVYANDLNEYAECRTAYYAGFLAGVLWSNDKINDNGEFYGWIETQINFDTTQLNKYLYGQADLVLIGKGLNNRNRNASGLLNLFKW